MKKRILFVTYTKYNGGAEKHLVDLILRLDLSIVIPIVLCFGEEFFGHVLNGKHKLNIKIRKGRIPKSLLTFWLTFVKYHPEIIVFINAFATFFPWYAYLAARMAGARRVFAIEQIIAPPALPKVEGNGLINGLRKTVGWRSRYMLAMKITGMLCDRTICVCEAARGRLVNEYGYPKDKTVTIWNGVDVKHYKPDNKKERAMTRERVNIGPDETVVVCVARLIGQKRIDILLKAMAMLENEKHGCKCVVVGDGPFGDELRKMSVDLGLSSSVLFVGYQEDVRPYLEMGDIFVLSSRQEGLPLALGEAMAYGLACIATDVGGNSEIVLHGHTGLIVPPESAEGLADAIKYLIEHREEREKMGVNARNRVEEFFNIDDTTAKLKAILRS